MCGENARFARWVQVEPGSSPRVRGKQFVFERLLGNRGLIPACAGKTDNRLNELPCRRAHPRVCGENADGAITALSIGGSSPRVRGKHRRAFLLLAEFGLIPACAGKTAFQAHGLRGGGAHPRVCGENGREGEYVRTVEGSSPRVRGKPLFLFRCLLRGGLIPACAGKTHQAQPPPARPTAHPRVCGENLTFRPTIGRPIGSSPRVRGKRKKLFPAPEVVRLIPACAGKT